MRPTSRPWRLVPAAACLTLLCGCPELDAALTPPAAQPPQAPPSATRPAPGLPPLTTDEPPAPAPAQPQPQAPTAPGAVPGLVKLSADDEATFTAAAVGRDGTVHALYRGKTEADGWRNQLYHRASRDGGATWSAPRVISADQPERHAGVGRLVAGPDGRVYAVWKSSTLDHDDLAGGLLEGTLVASALEAGTWSAPVALSTENKAVSFFAAPDPTGGLSVVWNEVGAESFLTVTTQAGWIRRADMQGARSPRLSEITHRVHGYAGLSGHIAADGKARFIAQRFFEGVDAPMLVYFDGPKETPLFSITDHYATAARAQALPPQLLVDANGAPHVITLSEREAPAALIDMTEAGGAVLQTIASGGEFRAFHAVQGPNGTLGVLSSVKLDNGVSDVFDLHALRFAAGAWSAPGRLTNNALGEQISGSMLPDGLTTASVRYNSALAAGAFDAQGGLNVVFVNHRNGFTTDTDRGTFGGGAYEQTFGAGVAVPEVFFTRVP